MLTIAVIDLTNYDTLLLKLMKFLNLIIICDANLQTIIIYAISIQVSLIQEHTNFFLM